MNKPTVDLLLSRYGIPLSQWGQGTAKTLAHLYREIESGESRLVEQGGRLVRLIAGVGVRIYFTKDGVRLLLREDRQVFTDGRVRYRHDILGLGEKMKEGENPLAAARRVFTEELSVTEAVLLTFLGKEEKKVASSSFPGLTTQYETFLYETTMPSHLYQDEYVEVQEDKSSFFRWIEPTVK